MHIPPLLLLTLTLTLTLTLALPLPLKAASTPCLEPSTSSQVFRQVSLVGSETAPQFRTGIRSRSRSTFSSAEEFDVDCDGYADTPVVTSDGLSWVPSSSAFLGAFPSASAGASPEKSTDLPYFSLSPAPPLPAPFCPDASYARGAGSTVLSGYISTWRTAPSPPLSFSNEDAFAVADLSGDGVPDFLLSDGSRLVLAPGSSSPLPFVTKPGGTIPSYGTQIAGYLASREIYAVAVDMDGDGDLDVGYAASFGVVGVYLHWAENLGAGVFNQTLYPIGAPAPSSKSAFTAASLNPNVDSFPDLVFSDIGDDDKVFVIYASAPGVFDTTPVDTGIAPPNILSQMEMADVDVDGALDLIYLIRESNVIIVFNDDAAGTGFVAGTVVSITGDNREFSVGDIDGVNGLDVVAGARSGFIYIALNQGSRTFSFSSRPATRSVQAELGDINNDGFLDTCATGDARTELFCFLYNSGSNDFDVTGIQTDLPFPSAVIVLTDANADGYADLLTNAGTSGGPIVMMTNTQVAPFFDLNEVTVVATPAYPRAFFIGDWNGDGTDDILVPYEARIASPGMEIFFGNLGTVPVSSAAALSYAAPEVSIIPLVAPEGSVRYVAPIRVEDVDGDSDVDILAIRTVFGGRSDLILVRNANPATLTFDAPVSLAQCPFQGPDGQAFVVTSLAPSPAPVASDLFVLWGRRLVNPLTLSHYACSSWSSPTPVCTPTEILSLDGLGTADVQMSVGDISGDNVADLVVAIESDVYVWADIAALVSSVSSSGSPITTLPAPVISVSTDVVRRPIQLEIGSFNAAKDSVPDLLVSYFVPGTYAVYYGEGMVDSVPTFTPYRPRPTLGVHKLVLPFDLDSDGHTDFLRGSGADTWIVEPSQGPLTYMSEPYRVSPLITVNPWKVVAMDVNLDSAIDLVTAYPFLTGGEFENLAALYVQTDGPVYDVSVGTPVYASAVGLVVHDVISCDVNFDLYPDLVVAMGYPEIGLESYSVVALLNSGQSPFFSLEFSDPATYRILSNATSDPSVWELFCSFVAPEEDPTRPYIVGIGPGFTGSGFNPDVVTFARSNPGRSERSDPLPMEHHVSLPGAVSGPIVCGALGPIESGTSTITDITADGVPDVLIACRTPSYGVYWAKGVLSGRFGGDPVAPFVYDLVELSPLVPPGSYLGSRPVSVSVGDVSGDRVLDVVISYSTGQNPPFSTMYFINFGNVSHPFLSPAHRITGRTVEGSRSVAQGTPNLSYRTGTVMIRDLDHDGENDLLAVSSFFGFPQTAPSRLGLPGFVFNDSVPEVPGSVPRFEFETHILQPPLGSFEGFLNIQVFDVDGDGMDDIMGVLGQNNQRATWKYSFTTRDSPLRGPAEYDLPVATCGYTLACIVDTIHRRAGKCTNDVIYLPEGVYTGCRPDTHWAISRSVSLVGSSSGMGTVFDCGVTPDAPDGVSGVGFSVTEPTILVSFTNVTFRNARTPESVLGGSALLVQDARVELYSVSFVNCSVVSSQLFSVRATPVGFGGALLALSGSTVMLENVVLEFNSAAHSGGGFAAIGSDISVSFAASSCVNNAANLGGGCVFFESSGGSDFVLVDSTVSSNVVVGSSIAASTAARGGALSISSVSGGMSVRMSDTDVEGNAAADSGGGMFAQSSFTASLVITLGNGTRVESNRARNGRGGGVHVSTVEESSTLLVLESGAIVTRNVASGSGGGLAITADVESPAAVARLELVDPSVVISGNTAGGSGGGVLMAGPSVSGSIGGVLISENQGLFSGGGLALLSPGAVVDVVGTRFVRNAAGFGGAVSAASSSTFLASNEVTGEDEVGEGEGEDGGEGGGGGGGGSVGDVLAGISSLSSGILPVENVEGGGSLGCALRGRLELDGVVLEGNGAVYGSVGFVCGSLLRIRNVVGQVVYDPSVQVGGATPSSGLFFTCGVVGGIVEGCQSSLAGGGDGCCLNGVGGVPEPMNSLNVVADRGGSGGGVFPWVRVDTDTYGALNVTLASPALEGAVQYGRLGGSPPTRMEWLTLPARVVSSGASLGSAQSEGLPPPQVKVYDGLGVTVVDDRVTLVVDAGGVNVDGGLDVSVLGSGRRYPLQSDPLELGGVALAVPLGTGSVWDGGVEVGMRVGVDGIASTRSDVEDLSLVHELSLQVCLPGFGLDEGESDSSALIVCLLCPEGTFSSNSSLDTCVNCPVSELLVSVPQAGATECLTCPENTIPLAEGSSPSPAPPGSSSGGPRSANCTCVVRTWSPQPRPLGTPCIQCPLGGRCLGGTNLPAALPGFYPTTDPAVFLECPTREACAGGFPFTCSRGYKGQLCGACARGFYSLNGRCYKCDDRTIPLLVLAVLLATLFVAFLIWLNAKEEVTYRFAAVLIGFNSLQISALYGTFELEWPDFARTFFEIISFVNLNFDLTSPECATVTDDVWLLKWMLTVALPLLAVIPFGGAIGGHLVARALGKSRLTKGAVLNSARRSYLQVITLLYLPLAATSLSYVQCRRDKDGRWVLEASPSKSCWTTWHWNFLGVAVFFVFLYAAGIPLGVWTLLRRKVSAARRSGEAGVALFELRYAFLVGRFSSKFYAFEVSIMIRKVAIVVAMTLFRPPLLKAHVALATLVGSLTQLVNALPYRAGFHNTLAVTCLVSCLAVLWFGVLENKTARTVGVIGALVINMLAIVVGNVIDVVRIWRQEGEAEKMGTWEVGNVEDDVNGGGIFTHLEDGALDDFGSYDPSHANVITVVDSAFTEHPFAEDLDSTTGGGGGSNGGRIQLDTLGGMETFDPSSNNQSFVGRSGGEFDSAVMNSGVRIDSVVMGVGGVDTDSFGSVEVAGGGVGRGVGGLMGPPPTSSSSVSSSSSSS